MSLAVALGILGCAVAVSPSSANNATAVSSIEAVAASDTASTEPVLKTYEARYQASALGLSATAYRTLSRDNDTYRLQNSMSLTVLGATVGSVTETSTFSLNAGDVTPLQYRYEQTGISARSEQVDFDWQGKTARSSADDRSWMLPLSSGVMDKLSFSLQLGRDITDSNSQEFSYQLVDRDDIDIQLYRITAEEVISTPMGDINTVRIERVRSADSSRHTVVWLARDWNYLLVKLEQVNGSGMRTELTLQSATIDGEPLRAAAL